MFPVYDEILDNLKKEVSDDLDKREGSLIHNALAPAAVALQQYYLQLEGVLNESFPDTASREYLIKRAKEKGITPKNATYCQVKIRCVNTFTLPIGSKVNCNDYDYTYRGLLSTDSNYKYYIYTCDTIGSAPNNNLGEVTPITTISGFPGAEIVEIYTFGDDEEETEAFRKRYIESLIAPPFGGNIADYKEKIGELEGVGGVKVIPVWNGSGTVKLIVTGSNYSEIDVDKIHELQNKIDPPYKYEVSGTWAPNETITITNATGSTIYTCKSGTLSANQFPSGATFTWYNRIANIISESIPNSWVISNTIYSPTNVTITISSIEGIIRKSTLHGVGNGIAPIGHDVTVQSVTNVPVAFKTTIEYETIGDNPVYAWGDISEQVKKVLSDYYLFLRQNWENTERLTMRINHFENKLLEIPGIVDFTAASTAFNKNNGTWIFDKIDLQPNEIPVYELDKKYIANYVKTHYLVSDVQQMMSAFSDDGNYNYMLYVYWLNKTTVTGDISAIPNNILTTYGFSQNQAFNVLQYATISNSDVNNLQTLLDPLATSGQGNGKISIGHTIRVNRMKNVSSDIVFLNSYIYVKSGSLPTGEGVGSTINQIFQNLLMEYYVDKIESENFDISKQIVLKSEEFQKRGKVINFLKMMLSLGYILDPIGSSEIYVYFGTGINASSVTVPAGTLPSFTQSIIETR